MSFMTDIKPQTQTSCFIRYLTFDDPEHISLDDCESSNSFRSGHTLTSIISQLCSTPRPSHSSRRRRGGRTVVALSEVLDLSKRKAVHCPKLALIHSSLNPSRRSPILSLRDFVSVFYFCELVHTSYRESGRLPSISHIMSCINQYSVNDIRRHSSSSRYRQHVFRGLP